MPQPNYITRLKLATSTQNEKINKYLGICLEKLGLIPNVLRAYCWNDQRFQAFSQLYNCLMLDTDTINLSPLEREMIAVVVSSANRCYYCLVAHGQAVREMSGDAQLGEMLVMNYRIAPLDNKTRTMLDFVWKLTLTPHDITEDDRQSLRAVGFDDAGIFNIAEITAFFNYTNRVAHATEMMPNPEYHGKNRI